MAIDLTPEQKQILKFLMNSAESVELRDMASSLGIDQSKVSGAVVQWRASGWCDLEEFTRDELVPGPDFQEACESGLPERRLLTALESRSSIPMKEASKLSSKLGLATGDVLKFGSRKGWFKINKGNLEVLRDPEAGLDDDEKTLGVLKEEKARFIDELEPFGIDSRRLKDILKNRGALIKLKARNVRLIALTDKGREELGAARVQTAKSRLTSEEIVSGAWKNVELKPFDVTLKAEDTPPAKIHPLQKILEETRRAFLEMGFSEIVSPQVESSFWNFDALFQPQDHPARDMQDTFYLKQPDVSGLPDPEVVDRVRRTHEDGWETGSRGWGYTWTEDLARKMVLRTHTTACTIRALAAHPDPPLKVFCVGMNFRNEAISYKHLPEFHQVDGIIIDEKANFASLLGTLKEFYRKMGFEKVSFKPAFFPYTEPSAEVFGWMPSTKTWIELGGSGVFRPEVTEPFGCKYPVLAWGLGLERLAMLRLGVKDIRTLYWSDLDWLRRVPLCR